MLVPNRHGSSTAYRYGFQGQEKDDELKGEGNSDNFKYRMHDPRIGRFFAVDPLFKDYPHNSTYAFQENKTGLGTELEGKELQLHPWLAVDAVVHPNGVGAHVIGIGEGLGNSATSLWNAVTSPVKTTKGIGNVVLWGVVGLQFSEKVDSVLGTNSTGAGNNLINSVYNGGDKLINGNGIERGTVVGEVAGAIIGAKGASAAFKTSLSAVTTTDGFLFGSVNIKAPFNIPVQRFGNMSFSRPDFWGARIGSNPFVNRTFAAIKTEWNPLNQFTKGIIPKGTPIKAGIIGPQSGGFYPGGSFQFITESKQIIEQETKRFNR
jgi:RHS repeat-associated protein